MWLLDYTKAQIGLRQGGGFTFGLLCEMWRKKKQKTTPSAEPSEDIQLFCWSSLHGGLRARTSVPCKGCSSQATAELPWASWGDQERCVCLPVRVHVCKGVMKYYVSCSSTHWLPYPICSARLSVPNKREPVGTSPSDSVSHTYVCDTLNILPPKICYMPLNICLQNKLSLFFHRSMWHLCVHVYETRPFKIYHIWVQSLNRIYCMAQCNFCFVFVCKKGFLIWRGLDWGS